MQYEMLISILMGKLNRGLNSCQQFILTVRDSLEESCLEARDMTQWLRTLSPLADYPGSIHSIHETVHMHL